MRRGGEVAVRDAEEVVGALSIRCGVEDLTVVLMRQVWPMYPINVAGKWHRTRPRLAEPSIPLTHSGVADFLPSPHTHSQVSSLVTTLPPSHLALVTHRAPVSRPARRRLTKTNRTTSWHNWFTPRTFFGKSLVSFLPTLYVIRERSLFFCTVHPNNREFVHLNNWKWKWVLRSFVQSLT